MCTIYIYGRKWFESSSLFLVLMGFKILEIFEKYWKLNNVILAFTSILEKLYTSLSMLTKLKEKLLLVIYKRIIGIFMPSMQNMIQGKKGVSYQLQT